MVYWNVCKRFQYVKNRITADDLSKSTNFKKGKLKMKKHHLMQT